MIFANVKLYSLVPVSVWIWLVLNILPVLKPYRRGHKLRVTMLPDGLLKLSQDGKDLRLADLSRLKMYARPRGIERRLLIMREKYLSQVDLTKIGAVVDIGANVGEFSLAAIPYARAIFAIEPEERVFSALCENLKKGNTMCIRALLAEDNGVMNFYSKTDTADSTLIKPSMDVGYTVSRISSKTLDAVLTEHRVGKIDLLKVEAEGAEPEVLRGARETLKSCRYVVVDAGPERNQKCTVDAVTAILVQAGFEILPVKNNIVTAVKC